MKKPLNIQWQPVIGKIPMEPHGFTAVVPIFTRLRFASAFASSKLRRMRRSVFCVGATAGPPLTRSRDIRRSAIFLHSSTGLHPWFFAYALFRASADPPK